MARTKGMLNLSGNLEVNAGAPLDARSVVPTVEDLTIASNFQYKYVGMPVVVQATGDMYVLTANDVTVAANWKPVGKTYKAGTNVNISDQNVISATDTTYTAGTGIDITNDEISTDNMPAADMSEIVTPLPSVMSRLPRYSTEEQIVAYWIDGKPIYQKTYVSSATISIPASTWTNIISDSTPIKQIVNYSLIGSNNTNYAVQNIRYLSDNIQVFGESLTLNNGFYLTIQYTKTTD